MSDTLPQWLYWRFRHDYLGPWEDLTPGDQNYWQHEAAAVRRAVARNGFKNPEPTPVLEFTDPPS